jgi:two-component sensor histidine kinase
LLVKIKNPDNSPYLNSLSNIIYAKPSYKDYYNFVEKINSRKSSNDQLFYDFVTKLPKPKNTNKINLDYVYLKWIYITKLRNNSKIDEATLKNDELKKYVNRFNKEDKNVEKATLLLNSHQIVLFLIENNLKEGKALAVKCLNEANKLKDNTLRIIFLNHLCDFLITEGDLDGYIKNSELSLALENKLENKSPYYVQTLIKLIDAYLYKGGYTNRVNELLSLIYKNPDSRAQSYSLYANFLRVLDKGNPITKSIFNKFEVNSYTLFCDKIEKLGKNKLNSNDFYHILDQSSKLLESKNYLREAIKYKDKSVGLTRKIYSEELSNSLANFKTQQAVKEKEIEIIHEKEKSNLFAIIAVLSILVLLVLIFVTIRKVKQEKLLKAKNTEIKLQRDNINKIAKEKELLLREVHHRVKNNFQIVASLLELQTKGIEDKKALELANDGKNRVKSMALIHQKLYQNENGLIDFDEYIRLLVKELTAMYVSNQKIITKVNSKKMMFDVDTAIPLGLIINELITNAYKYAFKNNKNPELNISISKESDDFFKLIISDNGPGLSERINLKKIKSLGLRLVTRLVKQLQGTIKQTNEKGAYFKILFKDTNLRREIN